MGRSRSAAGVPPDIIAPDRLLEKMHLCIAALGIASEVSRPVYADQVGNPKRINVTPNP